MATSQEMDHSPALWSRVEDGFYVCTAAGAFVGYVDHRAGAHHAFDQFSRAVGAFATLTDAMIAVVGARRQGVPS